MEIGDLLQTGSPGSSGAAHSDNRLREACRQLEAVFWNQLLQAMEDTIPKGGALEGGFEQEIYSEMLFEQFALLLSRHTENGPGELLYRQLTQAAGPHIQQDSADGYDIGFGLSKTVLTNKLGLNYTDIKL